MTQTQKSAKPRTILGRKVKKLRLEALIPANVYGKDIKSQSITVTFEDLKKAYKEAGETGVINLTIEGEKKTRPVMIQNIQVSPVKSRILHVDFRQVDLKEKITAEVPVEFVGESPVEAIGGLIVKVKEGVNVEALPTDMPDKLELDMTKLKNIGDLLSVKDLTTNTKITIVDNQDEALVKANEKRSEKEEVEEEVPSEEEAEEEVVEEKKEE